METPSADALDNALQHLTSVTYRSVSDGTLLSRSRTLVLLLLSTHGPTGQNIATEVEYYHPCKRRTPQHFTSADVSLSKRRNFLMEILYGDVATT